jgi:alcohol dehydrogenase YqhD (iron-dependent ADH family)
MENFEYYNPVKIIFGIGESKKIGEVAAEYGKSALIVSYDNISYMQDFVNGIIESLNCSNIKVFTCFNVTANPMLSQVNKGIEICQKKNIDVIIGVGGGSVMDTAKTIGVGSLYAGDVWDMFNHGRNNPIIPKETIPTIMIPTLPATSSEMNKIAVVTNDETFEKSHIYADAIYPKVSIVDPALTCSLPAYQTACGGIDAISHVMESYFNCAPDTPLQDRLQEGTIKTIVELLPKILENPGNPELRASIQWSSTLAWNGWLQAGVASRSPMHPIGHVLSARFKVTHGASLGIVMPGFFKYIYEKRTDRFAQLGKRVFDITASNDEQIALEAINTFEKFISSMGVQTRLSQVGIAEDDIEIIANDVEKINCDANGYLPSNPPVNKQDIIEILKLCI